jgi:carbamoyltransferase
MFDILKRMTKTALERMKSRRLSRRSFKESRHILGIACTGHGASIAYIGPDGVVRSSVLDRWVGIKNTLMFCEDEERSIRNSESGIDANINYILTYGFKKFPECRTFEGSFPGWFDWLLHDIGIKPGDIDLVVTSDSHFATCRPRLGLKLNKWFPNARVFRDIEHHAIHRCQAFWQSGFEEAAVLTLDTCGEDLERLDFKKIAGTIARMNNKGQNEVLTEFAFPRSSAGLIYDAATHQCGFIQGEEGKTMGLSAYGKPGFFDKVKDRLHLKDDGSFEFMDSADFKKMLDEYAPERLKGEELTQAHMDVAYAAQVLIELIVTNAFEAALKLTGLPDLVYAGGLGLNSVANDIAFKKARPRRLYIPTNPGDTGHALGCVLFGAYELAGWEPPTTELPEYLGPSYSQDEIEDALKTCNYPISFPEHLDQMIAQCIANGHIVARFEGRAEFGPRALGNRSILCDPRRPDMKDYLNSRVKHRESFRPFAPTVLEEHMSEWFEVEERSSYMLRVAPVRKEVQDKIPAVIHVDGSARLQTLSQKENPGYWNIIDAFHKLTGIPLVLNTSFNLAGKPIVETPADAVECFKSTPIDVLVMGSYLVTKGPLGHYLDKSR